MKHDCISPESIAVPLLAWYDRHKRDLPWRHTGDPYRIWVSEIMLQQTQVSRVIPAYTAFIAAFADINALGTAPVDEVLRHWAGMGYYSRARNLHRAAGIIIERFGGQFPRSYDEAVMLPGIGRYTAGAILSIAFGLRLAALDGNANRVIARLCGITDDIRSGAGRRAVETFGTAAVPADRPGDYNQALMELGAVLCVPRTPNCSECPLAQLCSARRMGLAKEIPPPRRQALTELLTAAAVVWREGRVLVAQRPPEGMWGGLWEFPWSEVGEHETAQTALSRMLRETLCVEAQMTGPLMDFTHGIMHRRITLQVSRWQHRDGEGASGAHVQTKWLLPDELANYAFSAPHRKIARRVVEEKTP